MRALVVVSLLALVAGAMSFPITEAGSKSLPIVMWHGMGDSAFNPLSMEAVQKHLEKELGVYVYSIHTGKNLVTDTASGFFGNANDQVESVCKLLPTLPELKGGFNMLGFSQGGQFSRAYVQRCNNPPVRQLLTFGGQHMGVADIPGCVGTNATLCKMMARAPCFGVGELVKLTRGQGEILEIGAYADAVRDVSIQAQYFVDPLKKAEYLKRNIFMPDVNNQLPTKKPEYKQRFTSLDKLVLVRFKYDFVVVPSESSWFQFYPWGSYDRKRILPMNETDLYTQDLIGLKELDVANKVDHLEAPFMHMKFSIDWLDENIVKVYLNGTSA